MDRIAKHLLELYGLQGKTVLVIGAGGTIGNPLCRNLALHGATVIPSRSNASGLEESVALIREATGDDASCPGGVIMRMEDVGSIGAGFETLDDLVAVPPDRIIVNAGGHDSELIINHGRSFEGLDPERVLEFFRKNVLGQNECFRQFIRRAANLEDVVGIATCSLAPRNLSRVAHYRMAKSALAELLEFLALDQGQKRGHRYLGIAPGFATSGDPDEQNSFATNDPVRYEAICNKIPLNRQWCETHDRWATGSEIADAMVAVLTRAFRYCTGEIIRVDGGFQVSGLGNHAI